MAESSFANHQVIAEMALEDFPPVDKLMAGSRKSENIKLREIRTYHLFSLRSINDVLIEQTVPLVAS